MLHPDAELIIGPFERLDASTFPRTGQDATGQWWRVDYDPKEKIVTWTQIEKEPDRGEE